MSRVIRWGILVLLLSLGSTSAQETQSRQPFPEWLVHWEPVEQNPLFEGTGGTAWDSKIRERGWICREPDGSYRLWYTGYNEDQSPTRYLGHATSPDGIVWTRDPRNPLYTDHWVEDMCVLRQGDLYYMFAEGKDDVAHLLTSSDGIVWERQGPLDVHLTNGQPIPPGPYGTPTVLVKDGVWHLFYERGDRGVWLATSTDLRVWTNVQDEPVIALGPEPYDQTAVALNQIIEHDGVYYGIYHANAHRPWRDWTTCLARSTDLIHWEKFSGNPIIANNRSSGVFVEEPDGWVLYTMHPDIRRFESHGSSNKADRP
ncbi:glycoside hydrolase family protein [Tautonia rosea]|uniref:glycosylase n=1 Tax=Tautonia rosea TaxID=2728037 RepID=UPI001472F0F2|nr:glycosylase [Tautonia rosea]